MTSARVRAASLLSLLFLAVTALVALPAGPSHAAAGDVPPSSAHPYSDPAWFPFRNPVRVSCAYSNCPNGYHGYYAVDFLGHLDDPIYPMGAGIFHVGNIDHSCPTTTVTQGTWAWVDHGAGGVTRYSHLNKIIATEGQYVTPTTEIATMGHNGNTAPCETNYTHVEWRAQRVGGTRLPIPSLKACVGGNLQSFPNSLGYSGWNSVPSSQINKLTTPTSDNSCVAANWTTTVDRPTVSVVKSATAQLLVIPSARPAGTTNVRVRIEEYHPSIHAYGLPAYRDIPVTQSGTHFSSLDLGYTYRLTAAFHNAGGWSAWAPLVTSVPTSPPTKPRIRGVSAGSNWITLSWDRASVKGGGTASYEVARRCLIHGAYVPWVYTAVGTAISYKWYPVRANTTCQVTVRGRNILGYGPWSTRMTTHT